MNCRALFDSLFPGFFQGTKDMPESQIFTELILDLRKEEPKQAGACSDAITFGEYHGEIGTLRKAVSQVEADWVQYFDERTRVFCAFDDEAIVAFCILSDWGLHDGLRVGGPGCVGTVPAYRRQGIGMEMVRRATNLLKEEGFDLSWIHYTYVDKWYEKLGYRTVLRWNGKGLIWEENHDAQAV